MKKSLFALAALTAIAGAAQAQSSVTLYGALDGSVQYINNANAAGQTALGYVDSAITSSVWGLKGSEDMGGGQKAVFNVEGDILTNNGTTDARGIFRRQANVGVSDAKLGEVALGLKTNPLIAAHGALMPLGGNSVSTVAAAANGYAQFFTRNAVTYTSPVIASTQAQLQYGFANDVSNNVDGRVLAGNITYTGIKNLTVRVAGQKIDQGGAATGAASYATSTGGVQAPVGDQVSYLAGASYKLGNATLAAGWVHNAVGGYTINNAQFGLGYQVTPKVNVGASYHVNTAGSSLINAQARYSLSPRTTAYAQLGYASNSTTGDGMTPAGGATAAFGRYLSVWNASGVGSSAVNDKNTTAIGLGLIHTF
jgi:predicted porin